MTTPHRSGDLHTSVQYVKGIGPRRAAALARSGITTIGDLLYYFPYDYLDLSKLEKIGNLRKLANSDQWITVLGTVQTFDLIGRPPRQRFVMILGDETGTVELTFFRSVQFFTKAFSVGETLAVSGKVTSFGNRPQIIHPSIDRLAGAEEGAKEQQDGESGKEKPDEIQKFLHTGGIVPKYGSSEDLRDVNLHVKGLRRIMKTVVDQYAGAVEEILPEALRKRHDFLPILPALRSIHFPDSQKSLEAARRRLKFDEFFSMQLMLALRRMSVKVDTPGIAFNVESKRARKLVDSLPFHLTRAQVRVIREITDDMKMPRPMSRLLQGDVGSGKTIVALIAMLIAIDNGYQAAFMAPTEVLAEQHSRTLLTFLKDVDVNVRLLIGGQRAALRKDVLEDIRSGSANIIVGTHALIQETVQYARLGLIVIDEQHRFGVAQRVALKEKGMKEAAGAPHPDVLVMTATPIPRTLSLTVYGDLDVSTIDELPLNRRIIKTTLSTDVQRESVYRFLREEIRKGRQGYIVYPLVEESEKLDLKAATKSYETLRSEIFPDLKVGLIHGRMSADEKDSVMTSLKEHTIDILVATTVIEVGIDVPNASIMVIEHAERFGLSQLHQLRGRVGRGAEQSYCVLIAPDWMGKLVRTASARPSIDGEQDDKRKAERRLKTMLETSDGFKIAEIDLELRGPGEFFGTRQSGLPELKIGNVITDFEILSIARQEAFELIKNDPHLRRPGNEPLRKHFDERMRTALALTQAG